VVVALGGNALARKGESGSAASQLAAAREAILALEPVLRREQVVFTHGNGPQVGNLMLQQESSDLQKMPLDVLDAMSQGQIGYFLASAISLTGLHSATLITRVVVDEGDPAFKSPSKPVGPFYEKEPSPEPGTRNTRRYVMDSGRGYRRVVPSPTPVKIREHDAISALLERGFVVIAVGGGGIPIKESGEGLEAVIDKDRASALLADQIDAQVLLVLTSVDKVYLDYGKPSQKGLDKLSVADARLYLEQGHFADGSMGPKVEAAVDFVSKGRGRKAIICSIADASRALDGKAGTAIAV